MSDGHRWRETRLDRPSVMDRLRSLFGKQEASLREDIEEALEGESTGGDLLPLERSMLKNVLSLHQLRVSDVMVPRGEIVAVQDSDALGQVLSVFRTAGHSRLPVYVDSLDDPRGMIHIRDFLGFLAVPAHDANPSESQETLDPTKLARTVEGAGIVRPVLFVPPSMPALELLIKMQSARTHMALVIDEYGGTDGLVSIEDLVELIVGDIEDEHDPVEGPLISLTEDGNFVVDARASLDEVSEALAISIAGDLADSVETVGGLVTMIAGRVPARGQKISCAPYFDIEVLDADPRHLKRVLLSPLPSSQSGRAGQEGREN